MGQYKEYEQYKNSGVKWLGKIPEHWKKSIIGYYFDIQLGKMLQNEPESIKDEEVFYLKALHVQWDKVTISDLPKMWASPTDKEKYGVSNGDLLICEGGEVGRANLLSGIKEDCIIQNALHRVRPSNQSSVDYLNYLMRHIADAKWFDLLCNKATISHLTSEKLRALAFPVPPLSEQKQIAQFLDSKTAQIDALIAKKEALLEKLSEQRSAIITQAVTKGLDPTVPMKDSGIEWLGEIPKHWDIKKLRYVGSCQNGVSKGGNYFGSGYPFVSYSDVYSNSGLPKEINGLAQSTKSDRINYSVRVGDIFFTRTSETIEEIGMASTCLHSVNDAIFSGFLIRVRPFDNLLLPSFSKYYFRSQKHRFFFVKEMNLVTRASLSQDLLKRLPVLLPPLEEQKIIAQHLDSKTAEIDQQKNKIQQAIALLKEYRTALITNAVTGKIDVRDIKLPESDQHQPTAIKKNGTNR